jgi:pimeloyl-ACP methyl ester carboxylesterase
MHTHLPPGQARFAARIPTTPHPAPLPEPVPDLAATATRAETPCGDGMMVWHIWGEGQPLVLVHGGTGSWRHWARNIAFFAAHRRVIVPDLPGLGESAAPHGSVTPEGIATIVVRGLERLLAAEARYDLIGFSFGAMIASQVAALHGARARSLTIIGAGALGIERPPIVLEKVQNKTGAAREAANRANLARFMFSSDAATDAMALAIQDWNTVHTRIKSRPFASATALRDAVARAPAKLAAIWGSADITAWPSVAARIEILRSVRPDVEAHIIEGAGHWTNYEAADAFNPLALDILTRLGT